MALHGMLHVTQHSFDSMAQRVYVRKAYQFTPIFHWKSTTAFLFLSHLIVAVMLGRDAGHQPN
jgi:hypothetical protein